MYRDERGTCSNRQPGRYRVVIAMLLFFVSIINYLDRAALGVAAPFLQRELNLSASELGLVFSIFFVGYAAFAFIGGRLADRYGPYRVLVWSACSWSVFCALTGVVTGFVQLLAVRALFGFAEGPITATTNRVITNWFPRRETARAIGVAFSGLMIGGVLAAPVVGYLALNCGWRNAFFLIGAAGVVWVLFWCKLATDLPRENACVGQAEAEWIAADRSCPKSLPFDAATPSRAYLSRPDVLSLGFGLFAMNYTVFVLLSWLPSYLTNSLHLSMEQMSWIAAIPWAGGFVGFIVGGPIADGVYSRASNQLNARKLTCVVPLGCSAITLLGVNSCSTAFSAIAFITATLMLLMSSIQSLWAILHELVPPAHMGTVGGFIHFLSGISGIIGPAATGFAVQHFGGFGSAFYIAAMLSVIGALAILTCVMTQRGPAVVKIT